MKQILKKYIPGTKEGWNGVGIQCVIYGSLFSVVALIVGVSAMRPILVFGVLAAVSFLIARVAKRERTEWICQTCHTVLRREDIKFGVCPVCGKKVKGFRGMRPWISSLIFP